MNTRRILRTSAVVLVLGLVGGWLISGGLVSTAQNDQVQVPSCPWGDQTFALATAPLLGGPAAHTFTFGGGVNSRYIWDGRAHNVVALVTVECTGGSFRVRFESRGVSYGEVLRADPNGFSNDSITVVSTYVEIDEIAMTVTGAAYATGQYWVVANLGNY
jgi:hypothetical protein